MASYDYQVPAPVREEIEKQISQMRAAHPALMEPYKFASVTEKGKSGYWDTNIYMLGRTDAGFWLGIFRVQSHLVRSGSPQTAPTEGHAKALSMAPNNAWRDWDRNRKAPWQRFVNRPGQASA